MTVGSRIITTTSDKEVALSCCNYVLQHNYIMRPLNVGDCKELFIRTVVGSRTVNLQLSNDVSDEIKRKCGGLPLAIMWTAILMASQSEIKEKLCQLETEQGRSKMEKEENLDSDVKKFLDKNLRIESTPVEILNQVLKLCYSSLPHYLKTCLLYLSVYPENYFFLKEDLVKLWIAEGFICTSEEDKVEVAGRYFDVLVSLGLIQRMDINCNKQHHQGEVVEDEGEEYPLRVPYVVHPTAFDFITSKSTEDNFITIIDYSQLTVAFKEKIRRLSLHFGSAPYATTPSSTGLSQVRTLSFMGLLSCVPSLVEFKLVRVLILHLWDDDGDKKFPLAEICKLLLLKYLQVRCNVTVELPSHIGCLKHLETLEINSVVTAIPSDVFHLSRLLHLRLGLKQNLTLGPVAAVTAICSDELLPPMDDSSSTSVSIPSVQIFELLLHICIFSRLPKWIPQLCKLSILEIVVRELFTTDIDMLADLPELTALSLYVRIPTAGNIVFCRGAFKALRYFRFMCGVLSLDFQEEAMPNLQQLMIGFNVRRREKYNNILTGIQHLLNLQEVVASIGPTMGTEEIDRIAAESALKDAINKHPRPTKFKVKREHQVEEEYCSMPPKRRREGSGGSGSDGGGGEGGAGAGREGGGGGGRGGGRPTQPPPPLPRAPPLKRRCRSFDLARVEKNLPPTYKLIFVNSMSDKIYTKKDVRAVDGGNIKIKMVVSNQQDGNCPRLLSSNVMIVVLDGDFNADNHEGWTPDEFDDHIVRPRDRVGAVLVGNLCVKLKDGEAYLHDITFIDNSRFTRSGKFRLGVKLLDDHGERVQEGVTEPFTVWDRRREGYIKREMPRLDDEVWRLKKIGKGGVFHMALEANGIFLVKHLMRLYHKDAEALRNILGNASQSVWTAIIDHAKTCDPGISLYSHFIEDKNTRLYVSSLGQIVGATIDGQYNAFGDLDMLKKALVEKLSKDAYKCITYYHHDYEMYNGQPRPINCSTLQESIIPGQKPTEPDDQNIHETDEQGTSKVKTERLGSVRGPYLL